MTADEVGISAPVNAGMQHRGEQGRTVAAMRATAQQLRQAANVLYAAAATAMTPSTAARLRALGDAVVEQADEIEARAHRLGGEHTAP